MKNKKGLIFILPEYQWDVYEEMFMLPVEERTDFLYKKVVEGKGEILGYTDKSAPELAIDLIKKGIKAKSVGGNQ